MALPKATRKNLAQTQEHVRARILDAPYLYKQGTGLATYPSKRELTDKECVVARIAHRESEFAGPSERSVIIVDWARPKKSSHTQKQAAASDKEAERFAKDIYDLEE
jgi:hypothetical protein